MSAVSFIHLARVIASLGFRRSRHPTPRCRASSPTASVFYNSSTFPPASLTPYQYSAPTNPELPPTAPKYSPTAGLFNRVAPHGGVQRRRTPFESAPQGLGACTERVAIDGHPGLARSMDCVAQCAVRQTTVAQLRDAGRTRCFRCRDLLAESDVLVSEERIVPETRIWRHLLSTWHL
jgi:hypothetical protein